MDIISKYPYISIRYPYPEIAIGVPHFAQISIISIHFNMHNYILHIVENKFRLCAFIIR